MKDLRTFVKDEFLKKALFEEGLFVDNVEAIDNVMSEIYCGKYINAVFKNTYIKDIFIDRLFTIRPDAIMINCNCSVDKFNEIDFNALNGLLIFNNIKKCKHPEIIESIKKHKGIFIC